jgi:hypothetical protein
MAVRYGARFSVDKNKQSKTKFEGKLDNDTTVPPSRDSGRIVDGAADGDRGGLAGKLSKRGKF